MKKHQVNGFTLIELVMVILIMGIISVVISRTLFQAYDNFHTANNIYEADWQAFLALERLKDDIRNIRSANDITTITASQLTFTDVNGANISFTLNGTILLRNDKILATGIQSLAFTYLDANGAATATPSSMRYVGVSITTNQDTTSLPFSTLIGTRVLP